MEATSAEESNDPGARTLSAHPFLLDGSKGRLHCVYHPPRGRRHPAGDLLVVPSFAEEMNRCRAMVTMQAAALAQIGIGTLVLDLYGTGDSEGDFADATLQTWLDDLQRGLTWLRSEGHGCQSLWGIRFGAMLAGEVARRDGNITRLLLWQPVSSGKSFYTQFLRIRIAAELNLPDRIKTTAELRELSAAGQVIEVSGYEINPELAVGMDGLVFPSAQGLGVLHVVWLEVVSALDDAPTSASSAKAIAAIEGQGGIVAVETVQGPPFWHVHEREIAPELVSATSLHLEAWASDGTSIAKRHGVHVGGIAAAEQPLRFFSNDDELAGVLHRPERPARRGVVIVVAGGPQYRAGAHRQFVGLARRISERGSAVLRFDLRGMGDSSGTYVGFQHAGPDIAAAIDTLLTHEPQLEEVVLLGECESASGILFYAYRDPRVTGAVLINPWVRTEEGRAQVIIKDYYLDRLRSPEFWNLVRTGKFDVRESMKSMVDVIRAYLRGKKMMARSDTEAAHDDISGLPLPVKVAAGFKRFKGRVLLLMSGHDYIAREFDEVTRGSKVWDGLLDDERVVRRDIEGADHTFSKRRWKQAASDAVVDWLDRR